MNKKTSFTPIVGVFIVLGIIFQLTFPNPLFSTTRPSIYRFQQLTDWSDLILLVKPTKIFELPTVVDKNKRIVSFGGWARMEVLQVWKGALESEYITIKWGKFNPNSIRIEHIKSYNKHLLFLHRNILDDSELYGAVEDWSFWAVEKVTPASSDRLGHHLMQALCGFTQ